jgi:hypothetical protein
MPLRGYWKTDTSAEIPPPGITKPSTASWVKNARNAGRRSALRRDVFFVISVGSINAADKNLLENFYQLFVIG